MCKIRKNMHKYTCLYYAMLWYFNRKLYIVCIVLFILYFAFVIKCLHIHMVICESFQNWKTLLHFNKTHRLRVFDIGQSFLLVIGSSDFIRCKIISLSYKKLIWMINIEISIVYPQDWGFKKDNEHWIWLGYNPVFVY